jgi:hypothetical protein
MPVGTCQVTINTNGSTTISSNQLSSTGASTGNLNPEVALVDNTQTLIGSANPLYVQFAAAQSANITEIGGSALALGQALGAASLPVVLTAAQITSLTAPILGAGTNNVGLVTTVQTVINPTANFTRPSNTTAYAVGQLVANSVTAASVVPMQFTVARANGGTFNITGARLNKSGTSVTNAAFRIHLFTVTPTIATTGDGGTFTSVVSGFASYLGYIDILFMQALADGASGSGVPGTRLVIEGVCGGSTQLIYGLIEARGAYTPASAEVFTVYLELSQN